MNRFAGDFAFYDRLMREIPHFDKSPREIKDDHSMRYSLENKLLKEVPQNIRLTEENIEGCELDKALYEQHKVDGFAGMTVSGTQYGAEEKKEAGTAILPVHGQDLRQGKSDRQLYGL